MAYFILGLVVGLGAGVAVTQQVHEMRRRREAALQAGATIAERPAAATGEAPAVTKKAKRLGIRPEDLVPKDDILERMQRAWERGISLEELDALEAAEAEAQAAGAGTGAAPADEPPPSTTTARLLAQDVTRDAARSALADDGYGDGLALDGGELSCDGCGTRHPIDLIEAERVFRFEDDGEGVTILLGLRCPACGATGTVEATDGPGADPAAVEAAAQLARRAGNG